VSQRIVSFILAALIFASVVVSSIFVIQSIRNEQNQDDTTASINDESTDSTEDELAVEQDNNQTEETMLQGTQLANFTPTTERVAQLQVIDLVEGTGDAATANSTVTAHYTGALVATGVIFQSSKDTGSTFTAPLSNLIQGWQQGIPGMKVGGTRRLVIPAALAYGDNAQGGIPADSDLVFDIELTAVSN